MQEAKIFSDGEGDSDYQFRIIYVRSDYDGGLEHGIRSEHGVHLIRDEHNHGFYYCSGASKQEICEQLAKRWEGLARSIRAFGATPDVEPPDDE